VLGAILTIGNEVVAGDGFEAGRTATLEDL